MSLEKTKETLTMSVETVNQFLQQVKEDQELQQELAQALNAENQQQATVELANKHGYQCSSEELWTKIQNIHNDFQNKLNAGEISEEELQAVAGGSKAKWAATGLKYVVPSIIGAGGALGAAAILDK